MAQLRPDRIALYGYAHLPERFKPQRRIIRAELPGGAAKLAMLSQALAAFSDAGYVYIGMDHFALPNDALAVAKRQGRLHRNFQGYSTQPDCDLIGLGVSAIGTRRRHLQPERQDAWRNTATCSTRASCRWCAGWRSARDDLARRAVIMALMCQGQVLFESIELAWLLDFREYFAAELEQLRELEEQGLVRRGRRRHPGHRAGLVLRARRSPWCSTATCRPTATAPGSRASSETPGPDVDHARGSRRC